MDITPQVSAETPLVQRYGPDGFTIGGMDHAGPVVIAGGRVMPWAARNLGDVEATIPQLLMAKGESELLLIGGGATFRPLPIRVLSALRSGGLVVDAMDTGAACRTFNILLGEDRRVMAALLPI